MSRHLRGVAVAALVVVLLAATVAPVSAQTGNIWQISFWPNPDWAGAPAVSWTVPSLTFNWGTGSPAPGIPADNFTARATTSVWFAAGTYQFVVQADDEVSLMVDGIVRLSTFGAGMSGKTVNISLSLGEGWHTMQVDYREFTELAYLFVSWTGQAPPPPSGGGGSGGALVPVPSAQSVQTQYGDYTPCIQQNIHQKFCFVPSGAWDSPNYGSIEMEPQIVVWGNCVGDAVVTMQLYVNEPPQSANCSKTDAGFFPK